MRIFSLRTAPRRQTEFLSAKDLCQRAVAITVIYLLMHLCGLREFTSVLNGTAGSLHVSRGIAALLGVIYVFAYLGFVVAVPILILAAALLKMGATLFRLKFFDRPEAASRRPTGARPETAFPKPGVERD